MTAVSRADGDLSLDQLAPYRGTSACEDRVRIIHVHPAPSKVEQANLASKNAMCLTRSLPVNVCRWRNRVEGFAKKKE